MNLLQPLNLASGETPEPRQMDGQYTDLSYDQESKCVGRAVAPVLIGTYTTSTSDTNVRFAVTASDCMSLRVFQDTVLGTLESACRTKREQLAESKRLQNIKSLKEQQERKAIELNPTLNQEQFEEYLALSNEKEQIGVKYIENPNFTRWAQLHTQVLLAQFQFEKNENQKPNKIKKIQIETIPSDHLYQIYCNRRAEQRIENLKQMRDINNQKLIPTPVLEEIIEETYEKIPYVWYKFSDRKERNLRKKQPKYQKETKTESPYIQYKIQSNQFAPLKIQKSFNKIYIHENEIFTSKGELKYETSPHLEKGVPQSFLSSKIFKTDRGEDLREVIADTAHKMNKTSDRVVNFMESNINETSGILNETLKSLHFDNLMAKMRESFSELGLMEKVTNVALDFTNIICDIVNAVITSETFSRMTSILHIVTTIIRYTGKTVIDNLQPIIVKIIKKLKWKFKRKEKIPTEDFLMEERSPSLGEKIRYLRQAGIEVFNHNTNQDIDEMYTEAMSVYQWNVTDEEGEAQAGDVIDETPSLVHALSNMLFKSVLDNNSNYAKASRFVVNTDNYIVRGTHIIDWIGDLISKITDYIRYEILHEDFKPRLVKVHRDMEEYLNESDVVLATYRRYDPDHPITDINAFDNKLMRARLARVYKMGIYIEKDLLYLKDQKISKLFARTQKEIGDLHMLYNGNNIGIQPRHEPFHLALVGAPGVGKTTLFKQLYKDVKACMGDPVTNIDSKIYINNPASEYYDAYVGQEVFMFDDVFQFKEPTLNANENTVLNQIIGRQPYRMNAAFLENKNTTFFCSRIVVSTMNAKPTEDVVGGKNLLEPESVIRRFKYCIVFIPKQEYRGTLSKHQLFRFNNQVRGNKDRRDMLNFDVYCGVAKIKTDLNYPELVQWLASEIDIHESKEIFLDELDRNPSTFQPMMNLQSTHRNIDRKRRLVDSTNMKNFSRDIKERILNVSEDDCTEQIPENIDGQAECDKDSMCFRKNIYMKNDKPVERMTITHIINLSIDVFLKDIPCSYPYMRATIIEAYFRLTNDYVGGFANDEILRRLTEEPEIYKRCNRWKELYPTFEEFKDYLGLFIEDILNHRLDDSQHKNTNSLQTDSLRSVLLKHYFKGELENSISTMSEISKDSFTSESVASTIVGSTKYTCYKTTIKDKVYHYWTAIKTTSKKFRDLVTNIADDYVCLRDVKSDKFQKFLQDKIEYVSKGANDEVFTPEFILQCKKAMIDQVRLPLSYIEFLKKNKMFSPLPELFVKDLDGGTLQSRNYATEYLNYLRSLQLRYWNREARNVDFQHNNELQSVNKQAMDADFEAVLNSMTEEECKTHEKHRSELVICDCEDCSPNTYLVGQKMLKDLHPSEYRQCACQYGAHHPERSPNRCLCRVCNYIAVNYDVTEACGGRRAMGYARGLTTPDDYYQDHYFYKFQKYLQINNLGPLKYFQDRLIPVEGKSVAIMPSIEEYYKPAVLDLDIHKIMFELPHYGLKQKFLYKVGLGAVKNFVSEKLDFLSDFYDCVKYRVDEFTEMRSQPWFSTMKTGILVVLGVIGTGFTLVNILKGLGKATKFAYRKAKEGVTSLIYDKKETGNEEGNINSKLKTESLSLKAPTKRVNRRGKTEHIAEKILTHKHDCQKCGTIFKHAHQVDDIDHHVLMGECPNKDCEFFGYNFQPMEIGEEESITFDKAIDMYQKKVNPDGSIYYTISMNGKAQSLVDPNADEINKILKKACFKIFNNTTGMSANGYIYHDSVIYCNAHVVSTIDDEITIGGNFKRNMVSTFPFKLKYLDPTEYYYDVDKDLCAINLQRFGVQSYRDVTSNFIKAADLSRGRIDKILISPPNYEKGTFDLNPNEAYNNMTGTNTYYNEGIYRAGNDLITAVSYVRYDAETRPGNCGTPVVIANTAYPRKILGIHIGSGSKAGTGVCAPITQEVIEKIRIHMSPSYQSVVYPITDKFEPNKFSIFKEEDTNDVEVIGSMAAEYSSRTPSKTSLQELPTFNLLYTTKVAPACMRITREGVDPMRLGIEPIIAPDLKIDDKHLEFATQEVSMEINTMESNYFGRGLLSDEEAINGVFGDEYVLSINMDTSAGYPFSIIDKADGKKHLVDYDEDGKISWKKEIQDVINVEEAMLKQGKEITVLFIDTKKDEKRAIEKVLAGKTRIFQNCNLTCNHLLRKYFQNFIAHCYQNCVSGPIAVGINPHSEDWSNLWRRMYSNGNNIIAGDYSKYDKKLPFELFLAATRIVNEFYEDEHSLARMTLVRSIVTGFHICGNSIYRSHHGMPSGVVLTAVMNSVINAILFRLAYCDISTSIPGNWFTINFEYSNYVQTSFYGDDHLISVSELIPWFNMVNIKAYFAKIGLEYTTNDKEEVQTPYISIDKVSFLKRKFVIQNHRINAPLEFDSLTELWNWTHVGNDPYQNLEAAIDQFFLELTHYSKTRWLKEFNYCRKKMIEIGIPMKTYDYYNCSQIQRAEKGFAQAEKEIFDKDINVTESGITNFEDKAPKILSSVFNAFNFRNILNPYPQPTIKQFISRPYCFKSVVWPTSAEGFLTELSLPYDLMTIKPIWDKLKNFCYFRYDSIEIQFRLNGTPLHYGDLLVCAIPQYLVGLRNAGSGSFNYNNQYSLFPNGVIIPANNQEFHEISYPMILAKQYINLNQLSKAAQFPDEMVETESQRIIVFVLNPIRPIEVELSIWLRFTNPEFAGNNVTRDDFVPYRYDLYNMDSKPMSLTYSGPIPIAEDEYGEPQSAEASFQYQQEGLRMREEATELQLKQDRDDISSFNGKASKLVGAFSIVPGLGIIATAIGAAFKISSMMVRGIGNNKPIGTQVKTEILAKSFNTSISRGLDYSDLLSVDPGNKVGEMSGVMGGNPSDMVIGHEVQKWGLLGKITITSSLTVGTKFASYFVHPLIIPCDFSTNAATPSYYFNTPLSFFTYLFDYWRGDLKYRVRICSSAFHTFKFRICWYPDVDPTQTNDERILNEANVVSKMVDISQTREIEFIIPYLNDSLFLSTSFETDSDRKNFYLKTCGLITFTVITPLNYMSTPIPDIFMNVMVGATENYHLAKPRSYALYADAITEVGEPQALVEKAKASAVPRDVCFGEDVFHVHDLIMRDCQSLVLPAGNAVEINATSGAPSLYPTSFFQYFNSYYRFWRGSITYTCFGSTQGLITAYSEVKSTWRNTAKRYNIYPFPEINLKKLANGMMYYPVYTSLNTLPVFTVPYYRSRMFYATIMTEGSKVRYNRNLICNINNQTTSPITISERASDDFQYATPIGAPTVPMIKNYFQR